MLIHLDADPKRVMALAVTQCPTAAPSPAARAHDQVHRLHRQLLAVACRREILDERLYLAINPAGHPVDQRRRAIVEFGKRRMMLGGADRADRARVAPAERL